LLRQYGIDPATIDDRTDLLTARHGNLSLVDFASRGGGHPVIQRVDLPEYTSAPSALVTRSALRRHGWREARNGWLIQTRHPLTTEQIAAARSVAATVGLVIETRSAQAGLTSLRTIATTSGALLALAIIAMTIGLIRGESASDLRTLTATGAESRTRRTLTASTAAALAVLGVALGVAGAYAALVAGYHSELQRLVPLPLGDLAMLAVGLPVLATAAGFVFAGREPRTFSRRALE
jgi:putative ABC transport system permease protein